jgi:HSP20 family protein
MLFTPMGPDPFALMRRLQQDLNRSWQTAQPAAGRGFPAVNIWQGADSTAVTAELPGVEPADIDIQVKEDLLTISGERKAPQGEGQGESQGGGQGERQGDRQIWHRRERTYGRFSRVIRLPYRADPNNVDARFEHGVLQIELHRPEEDKPRRIEIKAA